MSCSSAAAASVTVWTQEFLMKTVFIKLFNFKDNFFVLIYPWFVIKNVALKKSGLLSQYSLLFGK